jgi:predicted ATPase
MQFLTHAQTLAIIRFRDLVPIIIFRMVKMAISYGVSHNSAFAFASYGVWCVSEPNNDFEGGYKMGQIAKIIMQRFGANEV